MATANGRDPGRLGPASCSSSPAFGLKSASSAILFRRLKDLLLLSFWWRTIWSEGVRSGRWISKRWGGPA